MDLSFELHAANWQGAYDLALEGLKRNPDDPALWLARSIAAAGLTTEQLDKSKEALLAAQKASQLAAASPSPPEPSASTPTSTTASPTPSTRSTDPLDPAPLLAMLSTQSSYWLQQLFNARSRDMARDKPDNINYGLQMVSGNLAMNTYASGHSEKIANLLESVQTLLPVIATTPDTLRSLYEASNGLFNAGFQNSLNAMHVQRMQSALSAIRQLVDQQIPGYTPPRTVSPGGCAIGFLTLLSGASGLLGVAMLLSRL